ncbi:MAG: hypothetical protein R2752_08335 [Vicinamibacterales bacterium]
MSWELARLTLPLAGVSLLVFGLGLVTRWTRAGAVAIVGTLPLLWVMNEGSFDWQPMALLATNVAAAVLLARRQRLLAAMCATPFALITVLLTAAVVGLSDF